MKKFFAKSRGFTLVELLVVLVLMSLITLAFLTRQSSFDSSTIMRSLAYSIALSVRQAQVYGLSVRGNSVGGVTTFASSHGLYFTSSNNASYVLFSDVDSDNIYKASVGSPDIADQTFKLNSQFTISEVCAVAAGGVRCTQGGPGYDDTSGSNSASAISIMFTRPNPDANIFAYDGSTPPTPPQHLKNPPGVDEVYSKAYIRLTASNSGDYRFISVTNTGQVTVCGANVPIGAQC